MLYVLYSALNRMYGFFRVFKCHGDPCTLFSALSVALNTLCKKVDSQWSQPSNIKKSVLIFCVFFFFFTFLHLCDSQRVIYTAYHTVIGHSDWLLYVCIVQTPSISITLCDDFWSSKKRNTSLILRAIILRWSLVICWCVLLVSTDPPAALWVHVSIICEFNNDVAAANWSSLCIWCVTIHTLHINKVFHRYFYTVYL